MKLLRIALLLAVLGGIRPLKAQLLEVPTLESKGINGQVKTIERHSYQAVQDKGLIYTKKDVEIYDANGRLASVLTQNLQNNQSFKTIYTVDKKGVLTEVKIVNPSNNLALRTTSYEYKKGLLTKTTQTQGTNTVVKEYSHNKQKQLTGVKVTQNGTLSLEEFYELDSEDRRTKISRKLPADAEAKITSTFTHELKEGQLISTETRNTEQGQFIITKTMVAANRRDISEVTKRVSDGQQSINQQFFEDDEQGNWVKGEIIGDQYSRNRLVLRKFIYADGDTTGRDKMAFPNDYHAQFIRQYSQKQVAVNGKVYNSGVAYDLDYSDDRLAYVPDLNTWVVLKKYDSNSNMKAWSEAQVIGGGRDVVFWAASSEGIDVFNAGRKFTKGTTRNNYSAYPIGNSYSVYIRGDVNKSFLAKDAPGKAGQVIQAELTTDHFQWGKISDSTYVLTNRGSSVGLQKQIEDTEGNKLAMFRQGNLYYWYFLHGFRDKFENTGVGEIHQAEQVYDTEKFLTEAKYKADFSGFKYTKLANSRYRLLTNDGQSVTNIAAKTFKTPDDKLTAYFPLTGQYLVMEKFYDLEKGKEWPNQNVSIVTDSTAYVYYMYNDNQSINFYTPDGRIEKRAFANHKLDPNKKAYGAVVYDSANNVSYGMNYDLDKDSGFGPMRKLPANGRGAYIITLEGGRWVIVEKGIKVEDYTFSKISENGTVVHFFKDEKDNTQALEFRNFSGAEVGEIKYGTLSLKEDFDKYLKEFGIDPGLKKSEVEEAPKGKPLTFDREGTMLYVRDATGSDVGHRFSWFVTRGTGDDLIAYDSVNKATYRVHGFYGNENITEGKAEVIVKPDEFKVLKWSKSSIYLSINGVFQKDVSRSFITQEADDKMYHEVFYDQSEKQSYKISYPSDSNFHVVDPEIIPKSHNDAYLFRINEERFVMIEKGVLTRDKTIRSRQLGNALVRMIPDGDGVKGYLFKGYQSAGMLELIPATAMTDEELKTAWTAAGEELKKDGSETAEAGVTVPDDKWMTAINNCGNNHGCSADLIDQMGTALKKNNFNDQQIQKALIPYLVGIGNKNKDRLFEVFMKLKSDYVGTLTHPDFPEALRKHIRSRSMAAVQDYEKKHGKVEIKTVPYKKKGGGN